MQVFIPGAVIAVIGAVVAFATWRVGGIVILMVGTVLVLAAEFMASGER